MKIRLTKNDKIELLKAIQKGELDTWRVPSLFQCLEGANAFIECMKLACERDDDEETPPTPKAIHVGERVKALP